MAYASFDEGGYLWALDARGCPKRLSASTEPQEDEYLEWISEAVADGSDRPVKIQKVAASREHVLALDNHGYCYLYVCSSHTAIRVTVHLFENQRWYLGAGWYGRTLPTERGPFTDESGTIEQLFSSFELPSDGWRWEEPWMIDTNEQLYDKEGWQYAFNFGAYEYRKSQGTTSFVRRRKWTRTRRYNSVCRWTQINVTDTRHMFIDICMGGFDLEKSTGNESELYSLFALSTDGVIFWREGVRRNCPEGTKWTPIEPIPASSEDDDYYEVSVISCSSSSGLLFALTWDGRLFCRTGISSSSRCGTAWKAVATPKDQLIFSVAMGCRSLWMVTIDSQLWFTSLPRMVKGASCDLSKCITAECFTAMGDEMCKPYVTANDQVLAISQSNQRLFVRSDVREEELSGRAWLEIVSTDGSSSTDDRGNISVSWGQVDAGNCYVKPKKVPQHWVTVGRKSSSVKRDLSSLWRRQILESLNEQHEVLWQVFNDLNTNDGPSEGDENVWTMSAKVHAVVASSSTVNWLDALAQIAIKQPSEGVLSVNFRRGSNVKIEFSQLLAAFASCDVHRPNVLEVYSSVSLKLKIAFDTENERDQWANVLQKAIMSVMRDNPRRSDQSFAWVIGDQCHPRMSVLSTLAVSDNHSVSVIALADLRWIQQLGSLSSVSVGGYGIVWGIAQCGSAWALSECFNVLADDVERGAELGLAQCDEVLEKVYEIQRYSIFRGFDSYAGKAAGQYYAWSDATGLVHKSKSDTRLPNKYWHWQDAHWLLSPSDLAENPEEGWRYAKQFGLGFNESKGRIRRREWQRRRTLEMPAPWIRVESPRLSAVHVQKDEKFPLHVWGISTCGELLCREGVTPENPKGEFWVEVCSDQRLANVSSFSNSSVWALTTRGTILVRTCTNLCDIIVCDWQIVEPPSTTSPKRIEAGRLVVWILDEEGHLYVRHGISAKNLVGESWRLIPSDETVLDISVARDDLLHAILCISSGVGGISERRFARVVGYEACQLDPNASERTKTPPVIPKVIWEYGMENFPCASLSVC